MFRLTWRTFLIALCIALTGAALTILTMRIRSYNRMLVELRTLQQEVTQNRGEIAALKSEWLVRVERVEREVFGASPPPPLVVVTPPQVWQRNRDQELRRRIHGIEERLLRLER